MYPIFVTDNDDVEEKIDTLPGQSRYYFLVSLHFAFIVNRPITGAKSRSRLSCREEPVAETDPQFLLFVCFTRWGINLLVKFLTPLVANGLKSVIIFGVPVNIEKVRVDLSTFRRSLVDLCFFFSLSF